MTKDGKGPLVLAAALGVLLAVVVAIVLASTGRGSSGPADGADASIEPASGSWESVRIGGADAEVFPTLGQMASAADAVVVGKLGQFAISRRFQGEEPETQLTYVGAPLAISEVISGTVSPQTQVRLELLTNAATFEQGPAALAGVNASLSAGDVVVFLRLKDEPTPSPDERVYRPINSVGLWTASSRSPFDTPLAEPPREGPYAVELADVRNLPTFVELLRRVAP